MYIHTHTYTYTFLLTCNYIKYAQTYIKAHTHACICTHISHNLYVYSYFQDISSMPPPTSMKTTVIRGMFRGHATT